ncbi:MAG TPA: winged helix-turn-helix domain-containing protein [Terriglobales bacterium]|nr:winged helix-turn-helix domain-containing protein [Terriglobales bacterium]
MESARQKPLVRFGMYEISLNSGELRKAGMRIKVQQQPIKVLEMLLEHPGEVVTREELRTRVWPNDSFGDFDQAVNIAIGKLRSALGDPADNPRFIETLPKRGYRFIAEVRTLDGDPPSKIAGPPVSDLQQHQPVKLPRAAKLHLRLAYWIMLAAVVGLASLFAFWFNRTHQPPPPQIRSLAVLPLENLSGDAQQDYFADGMTDQLITDLAQIRALRVISRTSVMAYRGERKSLPEIARELNVDAVVEGTVLRSGDRVRITAQLIQAPADKHLWAETYEGNVRDTLVVQTKVAQAIAEQIRIELTPQEQAGLRNLKEVEPDAYENYLKGRYFWNKRSSDGLRKAIQYFNQAIVQDPTYAPAYSGLSDSYALAGDWQYGVMTTKEALPKAIAAAKKAIELDANLSEAHTSLAFCLEGFNWDWQAADTEFRRAIELNPGYATGHHWYSWHLALIGKNEEAISEMRKAQNLDPLSLIINSDLAELLLIARFPDASIVQSRKTIEMDSGFALAHNQLGQAYLAKSMFPDAISELEKSVELSGGSAVCIANLARAYAASGRSDKASELLNELKNRSSGGYQFSSELAVIYTTLGDKTRAIAWLERGYQDRFNPGVLLRPSFDPLRSDPRFKDLVQRIGLPR